MQLPLLILITSGLFASIVNAQHLENENLLQAIPPDYKIGHQSKRGNMLMTEFVPNGESVNNWTEMLTTQVFIGLTRPTPNEFRQVMQKSWVSFCKDANFADVAAGTENGYVFEVWIQDCPKSVQTGKLERVWFKAIKGNDSFYLIQKAFRFQPEPDQVVRWTQYLRSIQVCDTRLPDRDCLKVQ